MQSGKFHGPAQGMLVVWTLAGMLVLSGCSGNSPEIVPVTGTVTIKGRPYRNVLVTFVPTQPGLDGNMKASGVTDAAGKFTLTMPGRDDPSCPACVCKVTITEGPIPDSVRESENEQIAATQFLASLEDRPIPVIYTRVADTPLEVEVTPEENQFDLEVK